MQKKGFLTESSISKSSDEDFMLASAVYMFISLLKVDVEPVAISLEDSDTFGIVWMDVRGF
jgi:hypothetical protein